jgi:hypothetical protein
MGRMNGWVWSIVRTMAVVVVVGIAVACIGIMYGDKILMVLGG